MGLSFLHFFSIEKKSLPAAGSFNSIVSPIFPMLEWTMVISDQSFSTEQEAIAEANKDRRGGRAAVVVLPGKPYRLGLGVGLTREQALRIGGLGQPSYRRAGFKRVRMGGRKIMRLPEDKAKIMVDVLQQVHHVMDYLATTTAQSIPVHGNRLGSFSIPEPFLSQPQNFSKMIKGLQNYFPVMGGKSPVREALHAMGQALQKGVYAARKTQQFPQLSLLWEIQAAVLDYTMAYSKLIELLAQPPLGKVAHHSSD